MGCWQVVGIQNLNSKLYDYFVGGFKGELMSRFRIGQKVVCRYPGKRRIISGTNNYGDKMYGLVPGFNEIVTVIGYSPVHVNSIMLVEYSDFVPPQTVPNCFEDRAFEPLADITELTSILEAQPETDERDKV